MTKPTTKGISESEFLKRRMAFASSINGSIALISSGSEKVMSRDQNYKFHSDSCFYYLTGFEEPCSILVIDCRRSKPFTRLYLRDRDLSSETWTGERLGVKRASKQFSLDLVKSLTDWEKDISEVVKDSEEIYLNFGANQKLENRMLSLMQNSTNPRLESPSKLSDARPLLALMRSKKSREEIRLIKEAILISETAFSSLLSEGLIFPGQKETAIAALLDALFVCQQADGPAFSTIVASGKNATCLHHTPSPRPIRNNEFVLFDFGARWQGYSADISRTIAVGSLSPLQIDLHQLVHHTLLSCQAKCRPGVTIRSLHKTALKVLASGLTDLKLINRRLTLENKLSAIKKYFMHGIGHHLGLDVHDLTPLSRQPNRPTKTALDIPLAPGNVITLEPGLYFSTSLEGLPREIRGTGIRIENDVLITNQGIEVLTKGLDLSF